MLNQFSLPFSLASIAHMARLVQENLKHVIDAIGDMDDEKAVRVGAPTRRSTISTPASSASW